jgi:hypothetical protein
MSNQLLRVFDRLNGLQTVNGAGHLQRSSEARLAAALKYRPVSISQNPISRELSLAVCDKRIPRQLIHPFGFTEKLVSPSPGRTLSCQKAASIVPNRIIPVLYCPPSWPEIVAP